MTISELLEKLEKQRSEVDAAIHMIKFIIHEDNHHAKRASIIRSIKRNKSKQGLGLGINQPSVHKVARGRQAGKPYKPGTHWMQKPENRARVLKMIRKMHRVKANK